MEYGVSRYPFFSHPWLDRERKVFSLSLEMTIWGKEVFLFETIILSCFSSR